jgi:hypothetical protein
MTVIDEPSAASSEMSVERPPRKTRKKKQIELPEAGLTNCNLKFRFWQNGSGSDEFKTVAPEKGCCSHRFHSQVNT